MREQCAVRVERRRRWAAAVLVASWSILAGCNMAGPTSIANGRALYNDMICRTSGEQTLQMIVRIRYNELTSLLAVSSVTATVKVATRAEAQIGIGSDDSFEGNLVPFSASFAYEETPTIVYRPVRGTAHVTELLSPLCVETVVLLARAERAAAPIFGQLVDRINDVRNPLRGKHEDKADFERAVNLLNGLRSAGVADWVVQPDAYKGIQLVIMGYAPDYVEHVRHLLELLTVEGVDVDGSDIVLPVRLAVGVGPRNCIDIQTRSVSDLIGLAVAGVDVPDEHVQSGLADWHTELGGSTGDIRVRSARTRPENAMVAVQHHGWWFYIDGTDAKSKASFVYLQLLLNMVIEGEADVQSVPLLTLPVGS